MKQLLGVLIGVAIVIGCLVYVNADHKYTVVHFSEVRQDGYGVKSPETFKIEMSPAMAFHYAVKKHPTGFVWAIILLIVDVLWILNAYFEWINFGRLNGIYKFSNWIWFILISLSIILFFNSHSGIIQNTYLNLDRSAYIQIRGNDATTPFASNEIDQLFLNKVNIIE